MGRERPRLLAILGTVALAAVSGAAEAKEAGAEQRPPWFINGPVKVTSYDGVSDDLLTAGLGAAGIASATPPAVADPAHPTAAELRRLAIWSNYRALVDTVPGGGFGLFYGPGVGGGPEKIAGKEYLAYWRAGDLPNGLPQNVGLLVQIPASFDPAHACLIAGPSSGSRGVYGAIATAGEWGLKKGCAVAYTDKGTGTGAHDLHGDRVGLIDGLRTTAPIAGDRSSFTAPISEEERARYDKRLPDRYAFKHAHSEVNPERDWGVDVLQALRFALWALNKEYGAKGKELTWANTLVIASSVSNGGGASLRAAELAPQGMIDGVAVSEPNVNPVYDKGVVIRQGSGAPLAAHSRPLIDYTTLVNVYQGCANYGRSYGAPPLSTLLAANQALAAGTCASLAQLGLVKGKSTARAGGRGAAGDQRLRHPAGAERRSSRPTGCSGRRRASASPTPTPTRAPRWPTTSAATPSPRPRRHRPTSRWRCPRPPTRCCSASPTASRPRPGSSSSTTSRPAARRGTTSRSRPA